MARVEASELMRTVLGQQENGGRAALLRIGALVKIFTEDLPQVPLQTCDP